MRLIRSDKPNKNLIESLEGLLKEARSGNLQELVGAARFADENAARIFAVHPRESRPLTLIGALDMAKSELVMSQIYRDSNG